MKRRRFIRTLLADALFLVGLAAIVVGIALMGHLPLAVCVAGAECTGTGALLALSAEKVDEPPASR